jgi:hypothetical protein
MQGDSETVEENTVTWPSVSTRHFRRALDSDHVLSMYSTIGDLSQWSASNAPDEAFPNVGSRMQRHAGEAMVHDRRQRQERDRTKGSVTI